MKREKIKYILLIMLIGIMLVMPQAYAKTSIEIKPNASTVYTNKTISEFFDESMAMKNVGEGLEGADVDVHMATNTDWAIVSYFSNSAYGTNGEGKNWGTGISIDGTTYSSTNGNKTGVMNWGKTNTYTASVISNYTEISSTSDAYTNGRRILEYATNKEYVDLINSSMNKKAACLSWYGVTSSIETKTVSPYTFRQGLFKAIVGSSAYKVYCDGGTAVRQTFRPVLWN